MRPLVVVGDAFAASDPPFRLARRPRGSIRPGGAALTALLAACDGVDVVLCCTLPDDPASEQVHALLAAAGIDVRVMARSSTESATAGESSALADSANVALLGDAVRRAGAVIVADGGRGLCGEPALREALAEARWRNTPVVWDPHPDGAVPFPGCNLVTPNAQELLAAAGMASPADGALPALVRAVHRVSERWLAQGVAVTLGAAGALLVEGEGLPMMLPTPAVSDGDAWGAGNRFAAAAGRALARGAVLSWAVEEANNVAAAFVASGGARPLLEATPLEPPSEPPPRLGAATRVDGRAAQRRVAVGLEEARLLVAGVRARAGRVVATSGCFDLLHPGHIALLESARRLGDCLVVCVRSDHSARAAKGDGHPVVPLADRTAVLAALAAVDAVVAFDDASPAACLRALAPDLYVKGGDYFGARIPEEDVLSEIGGQALVVPHVAGHSTTRLVERLARPVASP